jgi:hypothetical protein
MGDIWQLFDGKSSLQVAQLSRIIPQSCDFSHRQSHFVIRVSHEERWRGPWQKRSKRLNAIRSVDLWYKAMMVPISSCPDERVVPASIINPASAL